MNVTNLLLRNNYIPVPVSDWDIEGGKEAMATIMVNLAYYGYGLHVDTYKAVYKLGPLVLAEWWENVEKELKDITGESRKMGDFVVYKNFPAEVLDKTEAEYWIPQILMYWGFPNEYFTEEVQPREKISKKEKKKAIVLRRSNANTTKDILLSLLKSPARWKDHELADALFLAENLPIQLGNVAFKENMVALATAMMTQGRKINISTATDVLRLATGLSDGDISLRLKFKFKSFKKPVRRFLLSLLEECTSLQDDVARRPEMFKRLFHQLHAGDYKKSYPRVCKVMDDLYNDRLVTFNSLVENALLHENKVALQLLTTRPGEFRRRLVHTLDVYGSDAAEAFINADVLEKLTTYQIVSMRTYLETVNDRVHRMFPPKGDWSKAQIGSPRHVKEKHVKSIVKALGKELARRVPSVKVLDEMSENVKLPSNGSEAGIYTRGTVFQIPKNVEFIRTVSYWQAKSTYGNIWFDNGWNFFDSNWQAVGTLSWMMPQFPQFAYTKGEKIAVFSGDPVNSKEMEGKACQMIDLYPSKLQKYGVRYAVWNILCYSRIPFSKVTDVFAALQWGNDAQEGKLFEPSRCQLSFPLTSEHTTKYICVIDLVTREMTYIDANLHANVMDASYNEKTLEKNMPAYMEYIKSLPSVHDLFRESVDKNGDGMHVLYSDADSKLDGEKAYVFKPENKSSKFKPVDLNKILT
jgi:hypothetical protein